MSMWQLLTHLFELTSTSANFSAALSWLGKCTATESHGSRESVVAWSEPAGSLIAPSFIDGSVVTVSSSEVDEAVDLMIFETDALPRTASATTTRADTVAHTGGGCAPLEPSPSSPESATYYTARSVMSEDAHVQDAAMLQLPPPAIECERDTKAADTANYLEAVTMGVINEPAEDASDVYRTVMLTDIPASVPLVDVLAEVCGGRLVSAIMTDTVALTDSMTCRLEFWEEPAAHAFVDSIEWAPLQVFVAGSDTPLPITVTALSTPTYPLSKALVHAMCRLGSTRVLRIERFDNDIDLSALCNFIAPVHSKSHNVVFATRCEDTQVVTLEFNSIVSSTRAYTRMTGGLCKHKWFKTCIVTFATDPCDRAVPVDFAPSGQDLIHDSTCALAVAEKTSLHVRADSGMGIVCGAGLEDPFVASSAGNAQTRSASLNTDQSATEDGRRDAGQDAGQDESQAGNASQSRSNSTDQSSRVYDCWSVPIKEESRVQSVKPSLRVKKARCTCNTRQGILVDF